MQKYKNLRFLDDESNKTYMIAPENLNFKGPTISNNQYCAVDQPLDWRNGDNVDLLVSRYLNYYCMLLIKGVEKDPNMGVKKFHLSIDDDSEATDRDKENDNYENVPETSCDGENMNASSNDEVNNYEDAPKTPYDIENMNAYSNIEENNDEVTPNPPTNDDYKC